MKCPKCGFNSFEFLDACKKCGSEFGSFKKQHRIGTLFFKQKNGAAAGLATESAPAMAAGIAAAAATASDLTWDIPAATQEAEAVQVPGVVTAPGLSELPADDLGQDSPFSGFSFSEDLPTADPEELHTSSRINDEDFSFGEISVDAETKPESARFDDSSFQSDDLLDPSSLMGQESFSGEAPVIGEFEFSGTSGEGLTAVGADAPPEKEKSTRLEDFDKEFEQIFAFAESEESHNS